jgi:biotin transport system substrate-specific component
VCYLLLGAVGAPVFHNFQGGAGVLVGPTGGYLMVYPVMAFIVAMTLNSNKSLERETGQAKVQILLKSAISMCVAHLVLYLGGTLWFCFMMKTTFQAALLVAVYPFIPLDILKIIFCIFVIVPLRSRLLSMDLLLLR